MRGAEVVTVFSATERSTQNQVCPSCNLSNFLGDFLLTLLGRGGAESARTFFRWLFLPEKMGLKVRNFLTFPNSL